jgi:hypothetical protein
MLKLLGQTKRIQVDEIQRAPSMHARNGLHEPGLVERQRPRQRCEPGGCRTSMVCTVVESVTAPAE